MYTSPLCVSSFFTQSAYVCQSAACYFLLQVKSAGRVVVGGETLQDVTLMRFLSQVLYALVLISTHTQAHLILPEMHNVLQRKEEELS